jgi:hypothetical protein
VDQFFVDPTGIKANENELPATKHTRKNVEKIGLNDYSSPWRGLDARMEMDAQDALRAKCPYFQSV